MASAKSSRLILAVAGMAAALSAGAPRVSSAVELTLVYPFPDFLIYTKQCRQLAADITEAAGGKVSIEVLPFNSIKMFQQPAAVRKGRVDLMCTPYAFFAQAVPENEAVSTSASNPATVRANGGFEMLDQIQQKHFGVKSLGWTASGGRFRIYMQNPPKFDADGMLDLSGVKLRDNPIYGAFFRAMNASTHPLPSTEVYSALEKGWSTRAPGPRSASRASSGTSSCATRWSPSSTTPTSAGSSTSSGGTASMPASARSSRTW